MTPRATKAGVARWTKAMWTEELSGRVASPLAPWVLCSAPHTTYLSLILPLPHTTSHLAYLLLSFGLLLLTQPPDVLPEAATGSRYRQPLLAPTFTMYTRFPAIEGAQRSCASRLWWQVTAPICDSPEYGVLWPFELPLIPVSRSSQHPWVAVARFGCPRRA